MGGRATHSVNSISFPAVLVAREDSEGCDVGGDDSVFIGWPVGALLSEPVVCEDAPMISYSPPMARWNLDTSSYS